jgi:pilus assembly protein CpaE
MPARILVIAAQPPLQEQLGTTLRRDGYEVTPADTAAEGLRLWGSAHPDLIVVESDLPDQDGYDVVGRIREGESTSSHTPVVLLGSGSDVDSKVRGLRAGADDYLSTPIHPQELSARVRGLLARFARTPAPVAPRAKQTFGRVLAFYGAKGGVGTTTLAINTAIALHREQKRSVALVDANLQFGDHRVFLDLSTKLHSIVDVVTASGIDSDIVRGMMVRHESGIEMLLAPPMPESAELVSKDHHHVLRIVEILRTLYDYVVVDLDQQLDDHTLDVIGTADRLIVVLTADLSCIKNVRLVLATMSQLGVPNERLMLVLNRSNAFTGISTKSVENVLKRQIEQQIGNDYRAAISSLNSGTPFMLNRSDSAIARGVVELAKLLDQQTTDAVEQTAFELAPAGA